ncbi:MerR family transcriptional regulator [Luteipulveratus mongoliensis]|uniref:MerR family transcriptional regulator n=1 Tax=Luteipulveratus mongoliensis TaxID=571913 RepID=A0A0K1JFS1_9MICO|nr:MerR family transcriptional regulator [Luteipulveratus mongoliensis]AKU15440.1 MerR family transcriptional regulator [Luteipulveratus mongoliensis]
MFTIGEFATIGRVSARMLRHYDAIGLLQPAEVDPHNGYRRYSTRQLRRLNRVLALKDLGFSLEEVRRLLDEPVDADQLRGMLRLRQAELARTIAEDQVRLDRVEARLRVIEGENTMSTHDVTIKPSDGVRLAQLSGSVTEITHDEIGPVMQQLYTDLGQQFAEAGQSPTGPSVSHYAPRTDGGLDCHAGIQVDDDVDEVGAAEVLDLPGLDQAASIVYAGSMSGIDEAYQKLGVWIEENGYRTDGTAREVALVSFPEPQEKWVTEIQMPVFTAEQP